MRLALLLASLSAGLLLTGCSGESKAPLPPPQVTQQKDPASLEQSRSGVPPLPGGNAPSSGTTG
jgi:hypothetical protein